MPGMDGMGPYGTGPVGRGRGPCGRGLRGYGRGLGIGAGRGFDSRGYGMGRGFGRGFAPARGWTGAARPDVEADALRSEAAHLKTMLADIERRLRKIESTRTAGK